MNKQIEKIIFDLDEMSLNSYFLRQKLDENSIHNKDLGYSIRVKCGVIKSLCTYFGNDLYGYSRFPGLIIKEGKNLEIGINSSVIEVRNFFGEPDNQWNDGVEENMQFIVNDVRIEFSWYVDCSSVSLSYLLVEHQ